VGRPLWREDGSVSFICYWPSPAQSFLGPSAFGLVTIFYCLRFETSFFVASYNSQGHGGGIRTRIHMGGLNSSQLNSSLEPLCTDCAKKAPSLLWEDVFTAPLRNNGRNSIDACVFYSLEMCLPRRCLAMNVYSDFSILAFQRRITVRMFDMFRCRISSWIAHFLFGVSCIWFSLRHWQYQA
jgi:hypothetical protein